MDDPIKIIYKYKNNNRRVQYNMYVFIGDIPNNIYKILKKIQDKQLYESLILLTKEELTSISKYYGDKWYNKFFNTYHINSTIEQIRKNKKQQDELIKKIGQEWYDMHIKSYELMDKIILYNYEALIKDEILRKEQKRKKSKQKEDEKELDYTTIKKQSVNDIVEQSRQYTKEVSRLSTSSDSTYSSTSLSDTSSFNETLYGGGNDEIHRTTIDLLDTMAEIDYNSLHDDILINGQLLKQYNHIGGEREPSDYLPDKVMDKEISIDVDDDEEDELTIEEIEAIEQEDDDIEPVKKLKKVVDENKDEEEDFEEGLDSDFVLQDEELDIDDLEKIYQDTDIIPDSNINQTSTLIQQALKDDKIFKKLEHGLLDFDTSKDNVMYDESLRNVYYKHYVTNQYIFKDDTIKTVKSKICVSIKNNPKFESDAYIAPSRQYLWSEYFYNNKLERIMVGQKWIKRSDILNIDIEPNNNFRFYEELRGNLKLLRDNIRRYGSKIKWEDDDYNIIYDYEGYYNNNEIYMIDIYNELGKGYNPDQDTLRNLIDVYIRVYFRRIKPDDIKYIIDYINGDTKIESGKIKNIYDTINNDLLIENEIMKDVEFTKKNENYKYLFKDNYITQSVIHVNLRLAEGNKIDLFRIYDNFIVDYKYPFIQYQTIDGQIIFKYDEKVIPEFSKNKENVDVLSKWFENAPYGISFKVRITENNTDKFMAINLSDTGRIEYKTQWKEEDMATINDIKKTYDYVKDLINKLNKEKNKVKFEIPINEEFKYAFINTIQKFELPEKFVINHNDLSEFARYFYPYIALVIEPRKRQSKVKKVQEKGKFGTYLRYKRVSKYENSARIEQRILYFMRNYDYNEQTLANEISKQFNITLEKAVEEIDRVKNKNPNIKKSRKILKKLENIPKYKPPGIGIDIQGKQRDRYKIRISGARNKEQLDRIITFYSILIYLYVETYLFKKPERQILKDKLKKLNNIAKRRNKVDDIVNYDKEAKTVKQMAQLDKKRIGFKPEKGQHQWTRACQNSGNDKKRRPQQFISLDDLLRQGFKHNPTNGTYEKKTQIKGRGGKKKDIIIRAVGLDNIDEEGNNIGSIYYTCNPDENAEHMFVGFLSRTNNPYGQCMPCCFKKDPLTSKNKEKKDYYLKCIGKGESTEKQQAKSVGDKLYILQDTNKIQEGRIGFLPKYVDYFFNQMLNKTRKIKHHYLLSSETGYYFKYGSKQSDYPFLNAVASAIESNIEEIKSKIIDRLMKDKSDTLFTALNNGDIKTSFITREKYIEFIQNSLNIGFDSVNHIISIPQTLRQHGVNIVILKKETITIKKTLEKEKQRDDFVLVCQNPEEIGNIKDPNKETIILIKENKNYYPVVLVIKKDELSKQFDLIKTFKYDNNKDNILYHIYDFLERNCQISFVGKESIKLNAKTLYNNLIKLNNNDYLPQYQVIDNRNKCKYLITNNSTIIPIKPSGSIYNLQIIKNIENKLQSFNNTFNALDKLYEISKGEIKVKPVGIYYDSKSKDTVTVIGIMTELYELAPIKPETVTIDTINKMKLLMEYKQLFDKVDIEISKGKNNYITDDRIINVTDKKYENEAYELFRLHLSAFLNKEENENIKKKITKIIADESSNKIFKRDQIRVILFRLIDRNLQKLYEEIKKSENVQSGGKSNKIVYVLTKPIDRTGYEVNNNRELCNIHKDKENCSMNKHCYWSYDECHFALTRDLIITFVNRISEELVGNDHKAYEILRKEDYFVSDIADYNRYKEREGQKIIKSTNNTIGKVLIDLFGKENIPKIGKRRAMKTSITDLQEMNFQNPLQNMGDYYIQSIIDENMSLLRAYANGYTWVKQLYYDIESRNLGYYSNLQTDISNYFRSNIIDWITDKNNHNIILNDLKDYIETNKKNFINEFINKITKDIVVSTNGIVEMYVLNKVYNIPIIIYDKYNTIIYIIDNGVIYDKFKDEKAINSNKFTKYKDVNNLKNFINIRFVSMSMSRIPINIEVAYYK
ncbi:putative very early transcription factor VETF [Fadolivirus algeromassiliense]|jgi:hypothetical protein|uniref:Very early transcription factor VETF n=1 Tax=Fadolivirus FV1/VV64 TaxID=3070911 RepID=A0A7D3QWV9_9VIRU|nr:putative very early transcription factor VETF [Fadolivirus algeromassiliense]QKF93820.1 putative very early transcription factor VETF [Fadolivirus FV1/VV64]